MPDATQFLRLHGLQVEPAGLDELIEEAIRALPASLYSSNPRAQLTSAEVEVLARSGLSLAPVELRAKDPLSRTIAEYVALLQGSLDVQGVARKLKISAGRVRQMLAGSPRRLFGIKTGSGWRIPTFQFAGNRIVPGWDQVVGDIDPTIHPVALFRWATQPSSDLVLGDSEETISPLAWLASGGQVQMVVELAQNL